MHAISVAGLVALLGVVVIIWPLGWPLGAEAQQAGKVYRVGLILTAILNPEGIAGAMRITIDQVKGKLRRGGRKVPAAQAPRLTPAMQRAK